MPLTQVTPRCCGGGGGTSAPRRRGLRAEKCASGDGRGLAMTWIRILAETLCASTSVPIFAVMSLIVSLPGGFCARPAMTSACDRRPNDQWRNLGAEGFINSGHVPLELCDRTTECGGCLNDHRRREGERNGPASGGGGGSSREKPPAAPGVRPVCPWKGLPADSCEPVGTGCQSTLSAHHFLEPARQGVLASVHSR